MVADLENKISIDNSKQGSYHESSLPKSNIEPNSPRSHRYSLGPQDVCVLESQIQTNQPHNNRHHNTPNRNHTHIHACNVTTAGVQAQAGCNRNNIGEASETNCDNSVANGVDGRYQDVAEQAISNPNFIITHHDSTLDKFLAAKDAPAYNNLSEQELCRNQEAGKSISMAFKDTRFGGELEENWERQISDFETLAFDYQLRRKYLSYFLRLTLN